MLITERTGYKMSGDNEGFIVTPEPLQKMYPAGEESEERRNLRHSKNGSLAGRMETVR